MSAGRRIAKSARRMQTVDQSRLLLFATSYSLFALRPRGHLMADKTPRFAQLTPDTLTDAQRPLAEQIMKISRVGIGGPYNALLRSPVMAQRMYDLLDYLRWTSSVPMRLNEFAILIQGRRWRSQVEWFAHFPLAVKAGLSEQVALDLKANKRPAGMQSD